MKMTNKYSNIYKITGMDCPSCAMLVESELEDAGIKAKVSYAKEEIEVGDSYDPVKISKIVSCLGYRCEKA